MWRLRIRPIVGSVFRVYSRELDRGAASARVRKGLHDGGGTGVVRLWTTSAATAARGPSTDLQSKPGVELENQGKGTAEASGNLGSARSTADRQRATPAAYLWVLGDPPDPRTHPTEFTMIVRTDQSDQVVHAPSRTLRRRARCIQNRLGRLCLLAHELGGIPLVGTLGNHDVMSRTAGASGPFGFAKIVPDFPGSAESTRRDFVLRVGNCLACPDWDRTHQHRPSPLLRGVGAYWYIPRHQCCYPLKKTR